eukprot:gene13508-biopygen20038
MVILGEPAEDASGTRPFLQNLSCGTRPGRVRGRFSLYSNKSKKPFGVNGRMQGWGEWGVPETRLHRPTGVCDRLSICWQPYRAGRFPGTAIAARRMLSSISKDHLSSAQGAGSASGWRAQGLHEAG